MSPLLATAGLVTSANMTKPKKSKFAVSCICTRSRQVICMGIQSYNPSTNLRAIVLANVRRVVQNHWTVITKKPLFLKILVLRLFPSKRTKPAQKSQFKSFVFSSSLLYMEEK